MRAHALGQNPYAVVKAQLSTARTSTVAEGPLGGLSREEPRDRTAAQRAPEVE